MIKKTLLLFFVTYVAFIYLESCNKECEQTETRNITSIDLLLESDSTQRRNLLEVQFTYETYFVQNFQFNLINKSYAVSQVFNPCFNELINPISKVSVVSNQDFSPGFLANTELNSLFVVYDEYQKLDQFRYNVEAFRSPGLNDLSYLTSLPIINETLPTLDSVHDLTITIFCENGDVFVDSIRGVNLITR